MSLELAILLPALLFVVFAIVQAGVYFHSRTLAITAAQEGLRAVSALGGREADGTAEALDFLDRAGADGWLVDQAVTAERSRATATVRVSGRAVSLVPGLPGLPISQEATGPLERATGLAQR